MIFGLGTHCYTAHILKQLNLQRRKSPFDWLFSRPAMVTHCLDDAFSTFLDVEYHRHVPIERRNDPNHGKCSHIIYDPMALGPIFNHHDPVSEPKDRAYFEQTVRNILSAPQDVTKFFVMVTVWPDDLDLYKKMSKALDFTGDRRTLVVNLREGHGTRQVDFEYRSDVLEVISFYPCSHLDGISFGEDEDDEHVKSILTHWLSRNEYTF